MYVADDRPALHVADAQHRAAPGGFRGADRGEPDVAPVVQVLDGAGGLGEHGRLADLDEREDVVAGLRDTPDGGGRRRGDRSAERELQIRRQLVRAVLRNERQADRLHVGVDVALHELRARQDIERGRDREIFVGPTGVAEQRNVLPHAALGSVIELGHRGRLAGNGDAQAGAELGAQAVRAIRFDRRARVTGVVL